MKKKRACLHIFYSYWGYFVYILIVFFLLLTLTFIFFIPFNKNKKINIYCIKFYCRIFFILNFKQKNFLDFKNLIKSDNHKKIYIANHTSIFDSIMIYSLPGIIKTTMKSSYLKIPLVNAVSLLAGNIIIKESRKIGESSFKQVIEQINLGSAFVLYPEGTRSKNSKISKFKNGAFKIGKYTKADLIPVVFDNWNVIRPGSFRIRDLNIHIKIMEPLKYCEYKGWKIKKISEIIRSRLIKGLIEIRNKRRQIENNYYRNDSYFIQQDIDLERECI